MSTLAASEHAGQVTRRDPFLDGLRGIAVLAVLYFHAVIGTGILPFPGQGFVGVLVFFVLSGYLITRILWREGRPVDFMLYRKFVRRRIQRLYPALIGLVVVGTAVIPFFGPEDHALALKNATIALFQLTSFFLASGYLIIDPWGPTWTLSVEWTFYLLWPLVLVACSRRGASTRQVRTVALVLAVVLYAVALPLSARAFCVLPMANLAVMLVGAALALTHMSRPADDTESGRDARVSELGLLLLIILIVFPGPGTAHVAYRLLVVPTTVICAFVILDQRPGTGGLTRLVLESRPMRLMGLVSYSVYLWHVPVLWTTWFALPGLPGFARVGIALALLVPVVWLSFTFLEKPWLHLAPKRSVQSSRT